MIRWTREHSVGIELLDQHHRHLFALMDMLHQSMSEGKSKGVILPILDELVKYTNEHFAAEEVLMMTFAFPGLIAHRMEHETLRRSVYEYVRAVEKGETNVSVELLDFLSNWLSHHVLITDMQYSNYLTAKGAA